MRTCSAHVSLLFGTDHSCKGFSIQIGRACANRAVFQQRAKTLRDAVAQQRVNIYGRCISGGRVGQASRASIIAESAQRRQYLDTFCSLVSRLGRFCEFE